MFHPFSTLKPQTKHDRTYRPVCEHSDPDSHRSHATYPDQINAQAKAEGPHSNAGSNHGKLHISCRTHAVSRNKRKHPYDWFHNGDPEHHIKTHFSAFSFHSTNHGNRPCKDIYHCTAGDEKDFGKDHQFLHIINCLVFFFRLQGSVPLLS